MTEAGGDAGFFCAWPAALAVVIAWLDRATRHAGSPIVAKASVALRILADTEYLRPPLS